MKVESLLIFLVVFTLCKCEPEAPEEPVKQEPIEDENVKIARDLYHAALQMLNSSTPNRHKAWDTMTKAADLGSPDAQVKVAFAKLFPATGSTKRMLRIHRTISELILIILFCLLLFFYAYVLGMIISKLL